VEKDLDYEYNYFEMLLYWMKKQVLIFIDIEKLSIFVSQQSIYFYTKKDYRIGGTRNEIFRNNFTDMDSAAFFN
jgi:hypothetical protein